MSRLPLTLLVAFCLLAAVPAIAQEMMQAPPPPLRAGTHAPAFETTTLAGKRLTLRSLRGKVVLLDYWATWCGPCRMATPTMKALHKKFHRHGFTVIGMSVDAPDTVSQVRPFVKAFGITYPVTVSPIANGRAQYAYRADTIPSQYLIDKRGIVRWSQAGFAPGEGAGLAWMIRRLLAEKNR